MSTDGHTNTESKRNVYDTCDPQYLRELRETAGMDLGRLARTACLSVAQVRQLETHGGGESLFYSEAIKRQAYKRLLMILGADPPTVEVPEALRDVASHLQTLDQIVAMNHQPVMGRVISNVVSPSARTLKNHKPVVGLLFVVIILFAMQGLNHMHDATASFFSLISEPNLEKSTQAVPLGPASDEASEVPMAVSEAASVPVVVSSAAMEPAVVAAPCSATNETMPQLTPVVAKKEGRYVYLVSTANAEVCVVDGHQQATVLQMKAGESHSVYGASPWQISSASLSKIEVFFQGGRVSLPDMATRVKLLETPVQR